MEMNSADVEPVTLSDILDLATWNRPRSSTELKSFINRRAAELSTFDDI